MAQYGHRALADPKHLNPREGITTEMICAHGCTTYSWCGSKAPQSPRGDYDPEKQPAASTRRALKSKAPQSPRGDYDEDGATGLERDAVAIVSKAPQSPRGDYDRSLSTITITLMITHNPKHLNPREGITTRYQPSSAEVLIGAMIQSTSIPARGLRHCEVHLHTPQPPGTHPKHLNPREGITTQGCPDLACRC
jgi:hypothetical protein